MTRDEIRARVKQEIPCTRYLNQSKGGLYECPFCGSGTGPNGTGAAKYYQETNTVSCFACKSRGESKYTWDAIDLHMQATGHDYNAALSELAAEIGLEMPKRDRGQAIGWNAAIAAEPREDARSRPVSSSKTARHTGAAPERRSAQGAAESSTESPPDYTMYYLECVQRLREPTPAAYLARRGISVKVAESCLIGFDPASDPASAPGAGPDAWKPHPVPRLIIPSCSSHYVGRRLDGVPQYEKMNPKGSKPGIFNANALYAPEVQEVFVTEGSFDALSLLEVGAQALALNSAANAAAFVKQLEARRTEATVILCLDNDEAGIRSSQTIMDGCKRLNVPCVPVNICGEHKDPNEALVADRKAFIEAVDGARRQAAARPDNTLDFIDSMMAQEIERFKDDISTGFPNLDEKSGGLYSGLYVLAAISSLGKTSLALQMADQIAAMGHDVLFFSLEQSKLEMVSKSVARYTFVKDPERAVTALSIRKGYLPRHVMDAARAYKKDVEKRVNIIEGNFNCDLDYIRNYIRNYIQRNNVRPVVFLDYLQIVKPGINDRGYTQSTKETVDEVVTALKRLSREMGLSIIVISSVNRANYLTQIDFESLKESGGIEYSADVVWGLQLQVLSEDVFLKEQQSSINIRRQKVQEAKSETPRRIELRCLKNRYGIANYSCYFEYFPANDYFQPQNENEAEYRPQLTAGRTLDRRRTR